MSLVATLRAAMVAGLAAADDTVTSISYTHVTLGVYNPATDSRTDTEDTVTFNTFVYNLKDSELDWFPADSHMQKILINRDDLNANPTTEDYVTIGGVVWEIASIKTFPGNVGYILFIRKT
jgi:hypothetical protein